MRDDFGLLMYMHNETDDAFIVLDTLCEDLHDALGVECEPVRMRWDDDVAWTHIIGTGCRISLIPAGGDPARKRDAWRIRIDPDGSGRDPIEWTAPRRSCLLGWAIGTIDTAIRAGLVDTDAHADTHASLTGPDAGADADGITLVSWHLPHEQDTTPGIGM